MSEKFLNFSKHQKLILNVNIKGVKSNITNLYGSVAHCIALWPKIDIRVCKYQKKLAFLAPTRSSRKANVRSFVRPFGSSLS